MSDNSKASIGYHLEAYWADFVQKLQGPDLLSSARKSRYWSELSVIRGNFERTKVESEATSDAQKPGQ